MAAALYPAYQNGGGGGGEIHYAQENGSGGDNAGETDLDAAYQERQQGRPLERKLSMSKPTNLDELLSEELDGSGGPAVIMNTSVEVPDSPERTTAEPALGSQHFYPEHERTQEIDIDAILFGDYLEDTPEETEEDLDKENANFSFNSHEIDSMTRLNTKLNSGPIITTPEIPTTYITAATGSASTSYSAHDKITTFNGETTFSASPPSPGYLSASLAEELVQSGGGGAGNGESIVMAQSINSYHHRPAPPLPPVRQEPHHSQQQHHHHQPIIMSHEQLQPQELELERQLQQLELQDRALLEEQKLLEVEQLRLAQENSVLQSQLEAKERERLAAEAEEKKKRKKTEVVFSEKKQVFTQRFDTKVEEPKKPKPKSLFNFDSLKKKKRKNKQMLTEGYDSAYEDLTDNEEVGKGYRKKDKKHFLFPDSKAGGAEEAARDQPTSHISEQQQQIIAGSNGEAHPNEVKKKTARGFTKFLTKDRREPLKDLELEVSDDHRESDNETVIVHPDEPVGSIPPPAEFRQNNLAESIVYELKKSSSQMNNARLKSPVVESGNLSSEDSISRGKNRFSMRKTRKDSVKTKHENGVSPPSREPGTATAAATSPPPAEEELLGRVRSRFSMRKPKKKESEAKAIGRQSEVESGEDSGSMSRVKSRFSLRKPKAKSRTDVREESGNVSQGDYESAPEPGVDAPPPVVNVQQAVENDQNEQVMSNQTEAGQLPERSRSTTPTTAGEGRSMSRQDSRNKKSSSGLAGIFGMRASKRSKSTERPKSSYLGQPPKGLQPPQRPRSAADLSKAGPPVAQAPPSKRPKGNLANYFGVNEESPLPLPSSQETTLDYVQIKKSQSADLVLGKTDEPALEEDRIGLIAQSKSIIGLVDSEPTQQPVVTYTEVDFKTAQNSRKVADEIKSRFQARGKSDATASVVEQNEARANLSAEKPHKVAIERPRNSPPARPQAAAGGEKPPSGAASKGPKMLNMLSKNAQPVVKEASSRSQKKMESESMEAAKKEQQKQQREQDAAQRQQRQEQQEQQQQQKLLQEQQQKLQLQQQQQQQLQQQQQQQQLQQQQQQQQQLQQQQYQQRQHQMQQQQQQQRSYQHQNVEQLSNSRPPSSLDGSVIGGRGRQTGRQSGRFRRGGGAAHSGSNHNLNMSHSLSINQSMNSSFDQDSIADLSR